MNCHVCHNSHCIKNVKFFKNLNDEEITEIEKLIKHVFYPKKTVIYHEGDILDKLIIVSRGKVKLVRYGVDGEEILLDILSNGDLYGGYDLFTNSQIYENVITLEDSRICLINNEDLKQVIIHNPKIGLKIIEYMNNMLSNQKAILEIMSIKDANKKIALYLLERCRRLKTNIVSMTQEDIGNSINLTKETVNRKLSKLQDENIIKIQGQKNIIILDKKKLEDFKS